MPAFPEQVDCDFTLALNNSTGKYFFCKDMIEASKDLINAVYYWRVSLDAVPPRNISLLSPGGALEEVAGDGVLLANPLDIADIADGMRKLAVMAVGEREERLARLRQSIDRFSLDGAVYAWRTALGLAIECSRGEP